MKLFLSLALLLVATKQANAQCSYTFCGGEENIENPDFVVVDEMGLTCADLPAVVEMTTTEEECAQIQMGEYVCCPSQTTQSCFVCGDAAAAFNGAKPVPGADGATCSDLNDMLRMIPPVPELCAGAKAEAGVNMASFCECPGVVAPDTCKVCGSGQTVNTTAIVSEEDGITCGAGLEFAKHVTNQTFCNMEIATADNKKKCCIDAAAGKSGGIDLSISSLVAALIAGLAFTI